MLHPNWVERRRRRRIGKSKPRTWFNAQRTVARHRTSPAKITNPICAPSVLNSPPRARSMTPTCIRPMIKMMQTMLRQSVLIRRQGTSMILRTKNAADAESPANRIIGPSNSAKLRALAVVEMSSGIARPWSTSIRIHIVRGLAMTDAARRQIARESVFDCWPNELAETKAIAPFCCGWGYDPPQSSTLRHQCSPRRPGYRQNHRFFNQRPPI